MIGASAHGDSDPGLHNACPPQNCFARAFAAANLDADQKQMLSETPLWRRNHFHKRSNMHSRSCVVRGRRNILLAY
jgi:hypothetical protein